MIYRYLIENGYNHASYTFFNEANIADQQIDPQTVPCGLLMHVTQKALQQLDIEVHLDQNGYLHECTQPLTLLGSHTCSCVQSYNAIIQQQPVQIEQLNLKEKQVYNVIDPSSLPQPILITPSQAITYTKKTINNLEQIKQQIEKSRQQEDQMLQFIQQKDQQEHEEVTQSTREFCIKQANLVLQQLNKPSIDLSEKYQYNVSINEQQSTLQTQTTEQQSSIDLLSSPSNQKNIIIYKQFKSQPKDLICLTPKQFQIKNDDTTRFLLVLTKNSLYCLTYDNRVMKFSGEILQSQNSEFLSMYYIESQKQLIVIQQDAQISIIQISYEEEKFQFILTHRKYFVGMIQLQKTLYYNKFDQLILIGMRHVQIFNIKEKKVIKLFNTVALLGCIKQQTFQQIIEQYKPGDEDQQLIRENDKQIIFSELQDNILYIQLENNVLYQFVILEDYFQPKCQNSQLQSQIEMFLNNDKINYILTTDNKLYLIQDNQIKEISGNDFQPIFISKMKDSFLIFSGDKDLYIYDKYDNSIKQLNDSIPLESMQNGDRILQVKPLDDNKQLVLLQHIDVAQDKKQTKILSIKNTGEYKCNVDQIFGDQYVEKIYSDKYAILDDRRICIRLSIRLKE